MILWIFYLKKGSLNYNYHTESSAQICIYETIQINLSLGTLRYTVLYIRFMVICNWNVFHWLKLPRFTHNSLNFDISQSVNQNAAYWNMFYITSTKSVLNKMERWRHQIQNGRDISCYILFAHAHRRQWERSTIERKYFQFSKLSNAYENSHIIVK